MDMSLVRKDSLLKRFLALAMCFVVALGVVTFIQKPLKAEAVTAGYNDDYAWQVLEMVNQERAAEGLAPLTMDAKLVSSAKVRATEIVGTFSHTRPDGTSCFTAFPSGLGWRGENIAAGQRSASAVMTGWMSSSGHRANILSSNFKSIGIACYYVPNDPNRYYYYWVQCFGGSILEEAKSPYTPSTVYEGIDYSDVYDYEYYINKYSDLKAAFGSDSNAALAHFVTCGMVEGRQAKADFNVVVYKNNYSDLRAAYGNDLKSYYIHYISCGKKEGRNAISSISTPTTTTPATTTTTTSSPGLTVYDGFDYSDVYDYSYYINKYADLKAAYGSNQRAALEHFIACGMNEGRQAKADFNVAVYMGNYEDLRSAFGGDLRSYYMHYIMFGKNEGRNAKTSNGSSTTTTTTTTTTTSTNLTVYNGVDYSAVYDYNYYINNYADLKAAYGSDQRAALEHFIVFGMKEGRQAKADFNVATYKNRYSDLQAAYGNDLQQYYIHYIYCGKNEGRSAK